MIDVDIINNESLSVDVTQDFNSDVDIQNPEESYIETDENEKIDIERKLIANICANIVF